MISNILRSAVQAIILMIVMGIITILMCGGIPPFIWNMQYIIDATIVWIVLTAIIYRAELCRVGDLNSVDDSEDCL